MRNAPKWEIWVHRVKNSLLYNGQDSTVNPQDGKSSFTCEKYDKLSQSSCFPPLSKVTVLIVLSSSIYCFGNYNSKLTAARLSSFTRTASQLAGLTQTCSEDGWTKVRVSLVTLTFCRAVLYYRYLQLLHSCLGRLFNR